MLGRYILVTNLRVYTVIDRDELIHDMQTVWSVYVCNNTSDCSIA